MGRRTLRNPFRRFCWDVVLSWVLAIVIAFVCVEEVVIFLARHIHVA